MIVLTKTFGSINPKPIVSVIVVAYNTGSELIDCLASLEAQTYQSFETIVIDNSQEDVTGLSRFPIQYYRLDKNYGPSYARNLGVEKSKGSLLAFLDDDAIADPQWLKHIVAAFDDKSVVALRGRLTLKSPTTFYNTLPAIYDLGKDVVVSPITTEGNSAIRRTAFEKVGGFNVGLYGQEGMDLSYRLQGYGRLLYIPQVVIAHDAGDTLQHFWRREYRAGYNGTFHALNNPELAAYAKTFRGIGTAPPQPQGTTKILQRRLYNQLASLAYHIGSLTYRAKALRDHGTTSKSV